MNGSVFKRKPKFGAATWCYSFYAGKDEHGKPINLMKRGYETKGAASTAMRDAIADYEKTHGKITRYRGALGTITWGYTFGEETRNGFIDAVAARTALADEIKRRATAEQAAAQAAAQHANAHDEKNPTFAKYIRYWLDEHASRTAAPKTLERYRDFAAYLTRHLGEIRINDLTTAQIQAAIHGLEDCGGIVTEAYPKGRPLAAKTVRHIGSMLYTSLSEADRLGILKIPHPMANKRVKLPKLPKRKPTVVEKAKLKALLDRARTTRLYPFIVLASATGCRRGELLALQWPDLNNSTGELDVSKSLEQTKAGLRVKSTKSGESRHFVVPPSVLPVLAEHRAQQKDDRRLYGPDYQDHNLIFCQPNGAYYSPDRVGARVKELMVEVGLEGVSLHSLRHTHASELLSKGVPIAVVSERLGHADQNITLSIYSHAIPADSRAAARIWDDALGDVIEESKNLRRDRTTANYCTEGTKKEALVGNKRG
jgi:integrase